MDRYVAFIWDRLDVEAGSAALRHLKAMEVTRPDWLTIASAPGVAILVSPSTPWARSPDLESCAVVIGRVFEIGASRSEAVSEAGWRLIVHSGGDWLLRSRWGRYISFVLRDGRAEILRDPSGAQPCFEVRREGVHALFADVSDLPAFFARQHSIDWNVVAHSLSSHAAPVHETGLREVGQLLPGERLCLDGCRAARSLRWTPVSEAAATDALEERDFAAELRETITRSVSAWTSGVRRLLLSLSGGLDSTIVLSAVTRASPYPSVICVNIHPAAAAGDERAFARLAASQTGVELIEQPLVPERIPLHKIFSAPPVCRITAEALSWVESQPLLAALGESRGADLFLTGRGGDHVLGQRPLTYMLADLARDRGIGRTLLREAKLSALRTRSSFWTLLGEVLRYGLMRRAYVPGRDVEDTPPYLSDDVSTTLRRRPTHPWLEGIHELPAGKATQIHRLCLTQSLHEHMGCCEKGEVIHPLLSQPIVELCLRMPSWRLVTGGRDRGLARNAFAPWLPREIIDRTSKGELSEHYTRLVTLNESFIREALNDGVLMRERILDRDSLEGTIRSVVRSQGPEGALLLRTLSIEAWARNWTR